MRIPLKTKTERRNKATLFSFHELSILLKRNFDNSVGVMDCISFFCKEERSFLRCPAKGAVSPAGSDFPVVKAFQSPARTPRTIIISMHTAAKIIPSLSSSVRFSFIIHFGLF